MDERGQRVRKVFHVEAIGLDVRQDRDRELVHRKVSKIGVESVDRSVVADRFPAAGRRFDGDAKRVILAKRRGHLRERFGFEDFAAEESLVPLQQVADSRVQASGALRNAHVDEGGV